VLKPETFLVQPAKTVPAGFESLSPAVYRASTIVFRDVAAFLSRQERLYDGYTYGQNGTPTVFALSEKIADLEGGGRAVLVPSGLAAIALVNAASLENGSHVLLPASAYGPTLETTQALFGKWGIQVSVYDPGLGVEISKLIRENTKLIWVECPGSTIFEMQDVPAIVHVAHERGVAVAMDNTWATPLGFRPLDHEVDYSIQALTKYAGGHSDLLMGSVTVRNERRYRLLRDVCERLGYCVSSDDCFLVLRGMGTLALRLERQSRSALQIARWLSEQPQIDRLFYPPLPTDPGHELWKRDFAVGGSILSFIFRDPDITVTERFVDALRLFRLGASWGGIHSLVAILPFARHLPQHQASDRKSLITRLHVGVEDPGDLIGDLAGAFARLSP
jgi:cystathionine beta-lyase